jgi:hypothetical protein
MRRIIGLIGLAVASGATAQGFDPRAHRVFPGPPSEVLVLGTPHLSGLPAAFEPEDLAPLLDRLAGWKPDSITVEDVSGVQCDELRRFAALHANAADGYCSDPTAAQRALGMDLTAATLAIAKTLGAWPKEPTPAERRRLAALFLAGGEPASALVQWLRLPEGERHQGDGIDAAMAARLAAAQTKRNESYLVAATLAARLGHERVYPVDDHTADDDSDNDEAYGKAVQAAWDNPATKARMKASEALTAKLGTPAATLALYRAYNRPSEAEAAFAGDFGAALAEPSAARYGRRYVAWWEVRNLRMVANIRAVLQKRPGARLLAMVGASHKGYFQAYLSMMHDVRIADAEAVLR